MSFIEELALGISKAYPDTTVEYNDAMLRIVKNDKIYVIITDDTWLVPKITILYGNSHEEQIHYGNMHEHAMERIMHFIAYALKNDEFLYSINNFDKVRWAKNLNEVNDAIKGFTKEFHLHLDMCSAPYDVSVSLYGTRHDIENGESIINTTQVSLISFDLMCKGYRLFVHCNGEVLEMKPYMNYSGCKEIRFGHNLAKLILSHHFDKDFE